MIQQQLEHPVIIAGGGLVGLTLAQALSRDGIPFVLYERDEGLLSRYGGWGITLQWCVPYLKQCLAVEDFEAIRALHNDPTTLQKDTVPYQFFNLETGEAKIDQIGPPHLRVSRLKLREILTHGLGIEWGISVTDWKPTTNGVHVSLSNGTSITGCLLACAEGKNSKIKRTLVGENRSQLYNFPLGFVGVKTRLSPQKMALFRTINPIFLHGAHPDGRFVFFSTISTPEVNGSKDLKDEYFEGQLNMSWVIGENNIEQRNMGAAEKLAEIKKAGRQGTGFFPQLQEAFDNIPDDSEVQDIVMQDWPSQDWPSSPCTTLLGDSVHPMAMYRGEAANHGIFDAYQLREQLRLVGKGEKSVAQAIADYESELVPRGYHAVMLSRNAGFQAHDIKGMSLTSDLFKRSHSLASPAESL